MEDMTDLGALEWATTLPGAVARFDELRTREGIHEGADPSLSATEALELLALSEVITRKVKYGLQLSVRTARSAGVSWADIGRSLGVSRQSAWETHARWIDEQESRHRVDDTEGLDADDVSRLRARGTYDGS